MQLVGRQIGNYVVREKLGEGGMGQVYVCEHPLLGRRAALKVLHEELAADDMVVTRFFREAKAANDIGHENIVDVYDFGRLKLDDTHEVVYLLMELLEGRSLGACIRDGSLSERDKLHVVSQCCSALAASHKKGIVHRDLKPENIYVVAKTNDPCFAKVLDFGIAKLMDDRGPARTKLGMLLGTPTYMSPEQCEAKGDIDPRSDVYSLGVVMYELFTGRVPFGDANYGEVLVAHMTRPPPPPSSVAKVAPEIEAIILHALEKDRARRFQSMAELQAAIADPAAHLVAWRTLQAERAAAGERHSGQTVAFDAAAPPTVQRELHSLSEVAAEVVHVSPAPHGPAAATAPPHRLAPLLAAIFGALALVGVGASIALLARGTHPAPTSAAAIPATTVPTSAPPTSAPQGDVEIVVQSTPPGATLTRPDRGDEVIGTTPWQTRVRPGSAAFVVEVHLPGYRAARLELGGERSRLVDVTLAPLPPPPAPSPPPRARPERPAPKPLVRAAPKPSTPKPPPTKPATPRPAKVIVAPEDVKILKPKF